MVEWLPARVARCVLVGSVCASLGWIWSCGGDDAVAARPGQQAGDTASAGTSAASTGKPAAAGQGSAAAASGSVRAGRSGTPAAGSSASRAGTAAADSGSSPGGLANPAPGSKLFMGANFWNIEWEGAGNYVMDGVNWATTQNPWRPEFLADLAPYHVLRFMDWNLINEASNPQASWETRKKKTDKQNEPLAYEWQIDLCNRTKKDYWVNIPSQANAEYFGKLAQLIKDQLDPSLRVYVEWSNEVWNGAFPQRAYAQGQGQKLGLAGSDVAASYLVYQSVRAFEAFEAVFGKGSPRVVKVIAGQAAFSGPCQAHVKALKDATINPNGIKADAYAIAPYLKGNDVAALSGKGLDNIKTWVADNYKCASGAGLPLIAYEGGQDSYAAGVGECTKLQHNAEMLGVYTKFLDAMAEAKLTGPFTHYTHSGQCWGLKEKTSDSPSNAPKYKAVIDWLAAH